MGQRITAEGMKRLAFSGPEGGLMVAELYRRAFDFVSPEGNWKTAIDKTISAFGLDYEPQVIADAITFMTGSKAKWTETKDVYQHVVSYTFKADGYYKACGA